MSVRCDAALMFALSRTSGLAYSSHQRHMFAEGVSLLLLLQTRMLLCAFLCYTSDMACYAVCLNSAKLSACKRQRWSYTQQGLDMQLLVYVAHVILRHCSTQHMHQHYQTPACRDRIATHQFSAISLTEASAAKDRLSVMQFCLGPLLVLMLL